MGVRCSTICVLISGKSMQSCWSAPAIVCQLWHSINAAVSLTRTPSLIFLPYIMITRLLKKDICSRIWFTLPRIWSRCNQHELCSFRVASPKRSRPNPMEGRDLFVFFVAFLLANYFRLSVSEYLPLPEMLMAYVLKRWKLFKFIHIYVFGSPKVLALNSTL